ncbi:hypothetical protein [Mucilaginibacter ginkgonis]|uniref:Uncharacterized protein n=1 Tax=Mucilaginibacter ginkgonis TaxID=2682091 RepID=A0A6I4I232_9SPHI|nr:hypothetical protein [Mucilaginibacter ginkgonis]QQL50793.1 hypothetical protein GO620_004870 [Mucilaginibacter ginkgonis]
MPADRVIKPNEIPLWLTSNFPVEQMLDVQQENIQQNVINGHHVIKLPVGKDAAIFLQKNMIR